MLTGETENSLRLKVTLPLLTLFVSMCPEMCKFCNKIALVGVLGSFPKLILASVLSFVFQFELKFFSFTDR